MTAPVLVVGAGPVGLVAALALAERGVEVKVLEKRAGLSRASKASTFHPPSLAILHALGAWSPKDNAGQIVPRTRFLDIGRSQAADLDLALLEGETPFPYRLHLEQAEVTPRLLDRLLSFPNAEIRFSAEVERAQQSGDVVRLTLADGSHAEGAIVVAADGAHSRIRSLAGIDFEGADYPTRVLRLMVPADLAAEIPGLAPLTYVFRDGRSCSLLQMPDCWRIILRIPAEVEEAQALDPAWWQPVLKDILPLSPAALEDARADLFAVSRRVAGRYSLGGIVLMGDAAHVTNTRGGMNMNCGIHDAWELAPAIAEAWRRGDPSLLEAPARRRRDVAVTQLIPRTDRSVSSASWIDDALARAADPAQARAHLRAACMLDMVDAPYSAATAP